MAVGRSRKVTLAFALILALGGCATNPPLDITQSAAESVLPANLKLANVRVGEKLANAEDLISRLERTVQSGKVYREVFTGSANAPAVIELEESSCIVEMGSAFSSIDDNSVIYSASVVLTVNGATYRLATTKAVSTKRKTIEPFIRKAIERGVIDLAIKARAVLPQP